MLEYFLRLKDDKIVVSAADHAGPTVIKLFSCSTLLSMKFQLLIKLNAKKYRLFLLSNSGVVFIMQIIVKMPTTVGIMSMINFMIS